MPSPPNVNNTKPNLPRSQQRNNGRMPQISQRQNVPHSQQSLQSQTKSPTSHNRRERRRHQRQLLNTTEPTQEFSPTQMQSQSHSSSSISSTSSFQGFQPHAHIQQQQKAMDPVYLDSSQPFCNDAEKVKHVLEVLNMNLSDYGTVSKLFRDFKVKFKQLISVEKRWFVIFDHSSTAIDAINIVKDSQFKLKRIDTNPNDVEMLKNNVPPPMPLPQTQQQPPPQHAQRPLTDTVAAKRMINQHLEFNKRIERERGNYPNPSDGPPSNHSGSVPPPSTSPVPNHRAQSPHAHSPHPHAHSPHPHPHAHQQRYGPYNGGGGGGGMYGGNGGHGQKKRYYRYPQEQQQHTPPRHTPPQHTPPQQQQQMTYTVPGSQQRYARKQQQQQQQGQQQTMRNNNHHYNDVINYNDHYVDGYGDY